MAEAAVVSVSMGVMKPVLAKLATLMGDEYKKIKGLHKKVTFLQHELSDMDALLEKMDSADELDPQSKKWRKDIIEMSYDIEDSIDDFMQRVGKADGKMGILDKAFKYLRTFKDSYHLANQFEEIKERVMEASERRQRYVLHQSIWITVPVAVDPRLSAIYKDSSSLVGIDTRKIELINWAMDTCQQLKVMSIVGSGGLGKTTLANEVYREVGGKFDCKAFVSVSQKPDMLGLFNSLLSQLGLQPYSHTCQLQDPINKLRGHLQDKRYLIVVDDLWDAEAWKIIRCAFPQNIHCSRVMITTRHGDVGSTASGGNYGFVYMLKPLSDSDSRKLFFDRIYGPEGEGGCPPELRKASSEVLRKCGGLPLAIITMASMLACQSTRLSAEQLEYIQSSLSSRSEETNSEYDDMMYILDLSYKNLPRPLKACFLYLRSYPEDHKIDRDELVRRWVAEGFVSKSVGQNIWDAAECYFNQLVNRSLIQPTYDRWSTMISSCRVHDMLLELIERKCKEDNFLSLLNDPQALVEVQDKVIRRLNIIDMEGTEDEKGAIFTGVNLTHIRSLSTMGESNWKPLLVESRFLRVLSLDVPYRHEVAMDLTVINQLPLLRYLKVSGDGENIILPCQIRGLRVLETLDFSGLLGCSISLEIVDVPRLSHLAMPRRIGLPDRIGEVISLRTLISGFRLPMDSLESIIGLGRLTALSSLHLRLPRTRERRADEATWMTALSLGKLCGLKQLIMDPSVIPKYVVLCADDALSSLSPPFCNLEVLHLERACTLSRVPTWIGCLHGLRELQLGVKQLLQEDVAIMGTRLPSLVALSLRIPGVPAGRIMVGGSTGFPALQCFRFNCDVMSCLMFEAGAMPALRKLVLVFDEDEWNQTAPEGLQHLPKLEQIIPSKACYIPASARRRPKATDEGGKKKVDDALIRSVFEDAANAHPKRPAVSPPGLYLRPIQAE